MNCEAVAELLPELLSGKLDRKTETEVLAHLACCPGCRRELAFWARVAEAAEEDAGEAALPQELYEEVRVKLFGEGEASALECVRQTMRALGLVRSACRLALATAGL